MTRHMTHHVILKKTNTATINMSDLETPGSDSCSDDSYEEFPTTNWSVSRDHPFKKGFVPLPNGDEIYIPSESESEDDDDDDDAAGVTDDGQTACGEAEDDDACQCGNCGEHPIDGTRVCCAGFPTQAEGECIINSVHLKTVFEEQPEILRIFSLSLDHQKKRPDTDNVEEYNRLMRHTAYVFAKDDLNLRGHSRTQLPDCLVIWIRKLFPSPSGTYVGFAS